MLKVSITVMFATRNGGEVLRRTLDGYCRLEPFPNWRMVVIDNGSTDDTLQILHEFQKRLPLTVYSEAAPGKNVALNAGLHSEEKAGLIADLYVFTDDDAVPAPGYLQGWSETAREKPDYDIFGGIVLPEFMEKSPPWLQHCSGRFAELYARNDRPESEIAARHVFGPNMAVRGHVISQGCRFDEGIGPNGSSTYAMGSETEFCVRLESEFGLLTWFTRNAAVMHLVRPWQMTRSFYTARAYRHGKGFAFQQMRAGNTTGMAGMIVKAAAGRWISWLNMYLATGQRRHEALWQFNWWRGYLTEWVEGLCAAAEPSPGFWKRRALALKLALRAGLKLPLLRDAHSVSQRSVQMPSPK